MSRLKAVIAALVKGMGVNAAARPTGASKPTVLMVLARFGCACAAYHYDHVRGLRPARVACDEIRSFVYCKEKNDRIAKAMVCGGGDCYTWIAVDRDTKLIIFDLIGKRTGGDAVTFMDDLAGRVINLDQLTADGFNGYPDAVKAAFGNEVNYGQLIRHYNAVPTGPETRYSLASCVGFTKQGVIGFPNPVEMSTSIVERVNLTLRIHNGLMTRLTNGHSKKQENQGHAMALFFLSQNYCRKHKTLKG